MSCLWWKAPKPEPNNKEIHYFPFTNFSIKVEGRSKTLRIAGRLLKMPGVRGFEMEDDGTIQVSAEIHPSIVLKTLKKAGRDAKVSWRYGECSSYLLPKPKPASSSSNDKKKDEKETNSGAQGAVGGYNYYQPYQGGYHGYLVGYGEGHCGHERGCEGIASECAHYHKQPGIKNNEAKPIGSKTDPKPCKH